MLLTASIFGQSRKEFKHYLAPYLACMDRPRQKVLPQLIEGILTSGSCLISQSARHINGQSLATTERRFLRTLASPCWDETDLWVTHLRQVASQIQDHTQVTIDITDLSKPYAQKMEALATVRDGSKKQLTTGYWMLSITAALKQGRILPITHEVFSQNSSEFKSQNELIFFWLECLFKVTGGRGIFVMDRGGDGDPTFDFFLNHHASFVIRMNDRRILLSENLPVSYASFGSRLPFNLRQTLGRHHPRITFDWQKVRLPHRKDPLTLIIVRRHQDAKPMYLLTNQILTTVKTVAFAIEAYFHRWQIEESFRFLKQSFGLEKFLIRNFRAIQRFFFILCLAWGFLARFLSSRKTQKILESLAFAFPKKKLRFFYYRWFQGLQSLWRLLPLLRLGEAI